MVRLLDTAVGLQRLVRQTQTRLRTRAPHRYRKKMLHLTNIQKAQRKLLRADRKEQVDRFVEDAHSKLWEMCEAMHALNPRHSAQYYFRLVMQASRLKSGTRSTSAWHAFVSLESEKANAALPEGADRKKVSEDGISTQASIIWKTMSKEEKIAATKDRLKEIEERKKTKQAPTPTVPIQAFNDARATIANVEYEMKGAHTRTGLDFLLVAVKSGALDFNQPYVFYTHSRIADFIKIVFKITILEFAKKLEGFCISGIEGLKLTYRDNILALKAEAARIISEKLQEATRGALARMNYRSFDRDITIPYGIVLENWPLSIFRAPGDISSAIELQTLIDAWLTGATRFRKLTDDEMHAWRQNRAALASSAPPAPPAPSTCGSDTTTIPPHSSSPPDTSDIPSVSAAAASLSSPSPSTSSPPPSSAVSTSTAGPATTSSGSRDPFIAMDVVTGADGRTMAVSSRPRKVRCDKNTKRNKKATETATGTQPPRKKAKKKAAAAAST